VSKIAVKLPLEVFEAVGFVETQQNPKTGVVKITHHL
jgi:hypothetical protein